MVSKSTYPNALYPVPTGSGRVSVECGKCKKEIGITRWEKWNGFLVSCPNCGRLYGHAWNLKAITIGSMFLHVLSFFLTMRPRQALVKGIIVLALSVGAIVLLDPYKQVDSIFVPVVLTVYLTPVVINLFVFFQHERDLGGKP